MANEQDKMDYSPRGESHEATALPTDGDGRFLIPLETIAVLNRLGELGVDGVESRLGQVLTDDVTVQAEQVKIDYARQETSLSQFSVEDRAGARVLLRKPFEGTVLVLFPVKSANRAASLMLERALDDVESVVSTEMGRDALTELCNMMANGFVDQWATVFETTIDTDSPISVQDPEQRLIQRVLKHYDLGLYITSRLHIPDYDIDGTIYVFPAEERFVTEISKVDLEVIK